MSGARSSGNGDGAGVFLAAVVVLIVFGGATVWITGAIAGILAGNGPVIVPVGETPTVLASLLGHLDDSPRAAWPADVRGDLPARTTMYAVLGATTLGLAGLALVALTFVAKLLGHGPNGRQAKGATWATRRDLRELVVKAPEPGRVVLGTFGRQLLAAETRASVLICAPSQSGKTTGLGIPAALEWVGPAVMTSVKGDLVHDTLAARARVGDVKVFDPTGSTGLPTDAWSPIAASETWEAARRTAARLLGVGQARGNGGGADEQTWKPAAAAFLAPLLLAAHLGRHTMGDVLSWIATTHRETPEELLAASTVPGSAAALDELAAVWDSDGRIRDSVLFTCRNHLNAWLEPKIAAATMGDAGITADWLLSGRNTLYLVAPAHEQQRLQGLFTALLGDVIARTFDRSTATGKPIEPALLLLLDEAANIAPLPNLDEVASTAPGQGVQLVTIVQNMSQIADRWGRDRAETIVANHRARIFGAGIGDRTTLEYLGATLGEEEVTKISTTKQRAELIELGSRTQSHDFKKLASPNKVRQAEPHTALLVYGRLPPAWIKLRPWFKDRRMRALVRGEGRAAEEEPTTLPAVGVGQ